MNKRAKVDRIPNPPPSTELPIKFMNLIKDSIMAQGEVVSDGILVIQKQLTESDVNLDHNQFTIPLNQIQKKFLYDQEEDRLRTLKKNGKDSKHISVMFVEPRCEINALDLKRLSLKKKNKNTKEEEEEEEEEEVFYVLTTRWDLIVEDEENKLREGDIVRLWAVRVGTNLWLVLVNNSCNNDIALEGSKAPPPPGFISFRNKNHVSFYD
ncbi:hypothetical protein ACH5RR_002578 [Cinchona calisaya]|uniref:TF-B3 domain-containing protein n=1 Tax=Cinchona calisaya TaxID=153742 RepID=A0ABD3ASZ2_9GENT